MGLATVPVDLLNPGQVFGCLGLMEACEILRGPCEGQFVVEAREAVGMFRFSVAGDVDPLATVLDFLWTAEARAIAAQPSPLRAKEPGVTTHRRQDLHYPCSNPATPSAFPTELTDGEHTIPIEHWADESSRDNVKFWAGAGGYSGAALTRDALQTICSADDATAALGRRDPFAMAAPMSSSFRFDWRRDYIPLDVGFSPNNHSAFTMVGYPLVELLAAIGLQCARPARVSARDKLVYRYGASTAMLPTPFARAVLGTQGLGFPIRVFRMHLGWPGQEGQARCIVDTQEERS